MGKIILYAVMTVALLSFASSYVYAANILTNPGFEEGEFPPTGWSDWSGSASGEPKDGIAGFPVPKEMARNGAKCVGKILYGGGERWGGFSQTVDVTPGKAFDANGWVLNKKNDGPLTNGAKVYLEVKFLDGGENEIKIAKSNRITQPTNWTKLNVKGLVPKNAVKAVYSIVLIGGKKANGKILFDDASLNISQ
ncbi:MAG: hypothetical protein PHI59_06445 [Candidatus Omnitrophica bacterium]|nr:hypothetical protein [Candidatus Omnitrophota bacterium]